MHLAVLFQRRRIVWQPRTLRTRQSQIKTFFDCGQTHARMGKESEREWVRESGIEREMGRLSECECRGKIEANQMKRNEARNEQTKPKIDKKNRHEFQLNKRGNVHI